MSYAFMQELHGIVPSGKSSRFSYFAFDLDASTLQIVYTNGKPDDYTLTQAFNWINANMADWQFASEAELEAFIDEMARYWPRRDTDEPPPEGGWATADMPGRGGRQ